MRPTDDGRKKHVGEPNRTSARGVSDEVNAITTDVGVVPRTVSSNDDVVDVMVTHVQTDFDRMFVDHYERLVRALTVVAGEREAAADAVQEAFVKAHLRWRKISRYDDPVGWIRRVAINRLNDEHRRSTRKRRAIERLAARTHTEPGHHEIDEFDRLLAELPRQQRAVTALFYVDGLSIAEISVALDIADGSVKSHLHDARRRLRPVLEREARREGGPEEPHHD